MSKGIARAGKDKGDWTVKCDFDHDLTDYDTFGNEILPEPDTSEFETTFDEGSGADTVRINGYAAAIVDEGITAGQTNCQTNGSPSPHPTKATTGSGTVFFEGHPVHRVGDEGEVVGGDGTTGKYSVNSDDDHNVFAG